VLALLRQPSLRDSQRQRFGGQADRAVPVEVRVIATQAGPRIPRGRLGETSLPRFVKQPER
jgi:hypothetical protein